MGRIVNNYYSTPNLQGQLKMARDALMAQQQAMAVVGHNVANMDTEGYTRQRVNKESLWPITTRGGEVGNGVRISEVQRLNNEFVNNQIRYDNSTLGQWEAMRDGLMQVEEVFGEINDHSLASVMDEFFNAWQDLANDADSMTARINLVERSETLANTFNSTANGLNTIRETLNIELKNIMDQINEYATQIADLNSQISRSYTRGQDPNTLLDQRDVLINNLSEIAGIRVEEQSTGKVNVYLGQDILVEDDRTRELKWEPDSDRGKAGGDMVFIDNGSTVNITGGTAYGKIEVRDSIVPDAMGELDEVANFIMNRVNELHVQGIAKDGTTGNYFWSSESTGALDMALDTVILDNPEKIAVSTESDTGDNALANTIFNVQFEESLNNNESNVGDYYRGIVARIGAMTQQAETQYEASVSALEQSNAWREHYSGVSLDEEMAEMIALQRTFQASAKYLNMVDDLLAAVISIAN